MGRKVTDRQAVAELPKLSTVRKRQPIFSPEKMGFLMEHLINENWRYKINLTVLDTPVY